MRGISKIFNLITSIIITLLLALLAYIALFTYNLGNVISERGNMKEWLTDTVIKEAYVDYIVDSYYSASESPFSGLIDEEQAKIFISDRLTGDAFDQMADSTIDTIYNWLEGRSDTIKIDASSEDIINDLGFIDEMYDDKLGILSDIIDPTDLIKLSDSLNIIDLDKLSANNIPYLYQQILSLPKKLLIVCLVLAVLLLLSNRSWRYGFFMIGLALMIGPVYTLFGYRHLPLDYIIDIDNIRKDLSIPSLDELPQFITLIFDKASTQIMSITNKYAVLMIVAGILIIVISQLAIREREVDDDSRSVS